MKLFFLKAYNKVMDGLIKIAEWGSTPAFIKTMIVGTVLGWTVLLSLCCYGVVMLAVGR